MHTDEAEANRTEQTVYRFARAGEMPLGRGPVQRAPEGGTDTHNFDNMKDSHDKAAAQIENRIEYLRTDEENANEGLDNDVLDELQTMFEELLDEKLEQMLDAMGLNPDENETPEPAEEEGTDRPDTLARQVLPYVKRLIAVDRERRL